MHARCANPANTWRSRRLRHRETRRASAPKPQPCVPSARGWWFNTFFDKEIAPGRRQVRIAFRRPPSPPTCANGTGTLVVSAATSQVAAAPKGPKRPTTAWRLSGRRGARSNSRSRGVTRTIGHSRSTGAASSATAALPTAQPRPTTAEVPTGDVRVAGRIAPRLMAHHRRPDALQARSGPWARWARDARKTARATETRGWRSWRSNCLGFRERRRPRPARGARAHEGRSARQARSASHPTLQR